MIEAIEDNIKNKIYEIRGKQVMLDSDLAMLYEAETKYLNRQVKRNIERFDDDFMFQLTEDEYKDLRCQNVTSKSEYGGRRYSPYVFTEMGATAVAGVLHSDIAIEMSKKVVRAFVSMRHYLSSNLIEQKYINNLVLEHDNSIKLLQESFNKFEEKKNEIYFEGQIWDAYYKIFDIFNKTKNELIIIDAYADNVVLNLIRNLNINVIIITSSSLLTKQDICRYNRQYHNLKVIYDNTFHDRFFIIDKMIVYHCGTSINRIGYKTFAINLISDEDAYNGILTKLKLILDNKTSLYR